MRTMLALGSLALAATSQTACLYTDPIVSLEEEKLSPTVGLCCATPALDVKEVLPAADTTQLDFDISVIEDPNVDDTLRVRFFVDGGNVIYLERTVRPTEPIALAARPLTGPNAVHLTLPASELAPGVTHRVEAVISDRGFKSDDTGDVRDNRDVTDDANGHYLYWEVELQ